MDFFQGLVERILIDLTRAQHQANRFSATLAPIYEDPEKHEQPPALSYFPVPNAHVASFAFTLAFGIEELTELLHKDAPALVAEAGKSLCRWLRQQFDEGAEKPGDSKLQEIEDEAKRLLAVWVLKSRIESTADVPPRLKAICASLSEWLEPILSELSVQGPDTATIENLVGAPLTSLLSLQDFAAEATAAPLSRAALDTAKLNEHDVASLCSITVNADLRDFRLGFSDGERGAGMLIQSQ